MNLAFHIARRYLFSKKSHNAINIISMVSVFGVAAATIAMVCTLSVFNGFQDLLKGLYKNFEPELKIRAFEGKTFKLSSEFDFIRAHKEVAVFCESLEENALIKYKGSQASALVKGVSDNFSELANMDSLIYVGKFVLEEEGFQFASIGIGLASLLGTGSSFIDPVVLYAPKRTGPLNPLNPASAFKTRRILLTASFGIDQPEYDDQLIVVPLSFARELFEYTDELSSVELKLKKGANLKRVKEEFRQVLGPGFIVEDLQEQKADVYRINRIEKWITYLILCFILLIALFNVIGSLSMLILEKKQDAGILKRLGADHKTIRKVFLYEGVMIAFLGAFSGILLGVLLCLLQQHFGLLRLGRGDFIVDAYPVLVKAVDLFFILLTVLAVSLPSVWWPVHYYFKNDELP